MGTDTYEFQRIAESELHKARSMGRDDRGRQNFYNEANAIASMAHSLQSIAASLHILTRRRGTLSDQIARSIGDQSNCSTPKEENIS